MKKEEIIKQIRTKKSFLCVGLDTDISKIPKFLLSYDDPIFEFNKRIIDATKDLCVAYKPNIAFYESGLESLSKSIVDSLKQIDKKAKVIIMGDFNDDP